MTADSDLRWIKPVSPVLVNIRVLADGAGTWALLDLIERPVPDEYRARPAEWLYTHTTHLIQGVDRTDRFEMPALALTDGQDRIVAQIGIPGERAWGRLRGTTLPRFEEGDRTIVFPPVPDHALW